MDNEHLVSARANLCSCKMFGPKIKSSPLKIVERRTLIMSSSLHMKFSSQPKKFSSPLTKCTLCSFNSSTPKFMFKLTSPQMLGSMKLNINSGAVTLNFSPFSVELHLMCPYNLPPNTLIVLYKQILYKLKKKSGNGYFDNTTVC